MDTGGETIIFSERPRRTGDVVTSDHSNRKASRKGSEAGIKASDHVQALWLWCREDGGVRLAAAANTRQSTSNSAEVFEQEPGSFNNVHAREKDETM